MAKKIFRKFLESSGIFHQKISQTFLFSKSGVFAKKNILKDAREETKNRPKKREKEKKKINRKEKEKQKKIKMQKILESPSLIFLCP